MKQVGREAHADRPARGSLIRRPGVCALMSLAAGGLVVAILMGAPLVSILIVGLLLLCPLLMWVPFRFEQEARDRSRPADTRPHVG